MGFFRGEADIVGVARENAGESTGSVERNSEDQVPGKFWQGMRSQKVEGATH